MAHDLDNLHATMEKVIDLMVTGRGPLDERLASAGEQLGQLNFLNEREVPDDYRETLLPILDWANNPIDDVRESERLARDLVRIRDSVRTKVGKSVTSMSSTALPSRSRQ